MCLTRPADWWDTADDGARLALMLCSICPARLACPEDGTVGVIRGGIAYSDDGERLPLCPCGYPVPYPVRAVCYRCIPSKHTVVPKLKRRGRPRQLDTHLQTIVDMLAQGISPTRIGPLIGVPSSTVRYWVLHYKLRPQPVSTVVDTP